MEEQPNAASTTISTSEVAQAQPKPPKKAAAAKPKAKGKKAKTASPTKVKEFVEKFRAGTIGRLTVELIVAGQKTNDEILKAVKAAHKGSTTTAACIAWYRSKARKEGIIA